MKLQYFTFFKAIYFIVSLLVILFSVSERTVLPIVGIVLGAVVLSFMQLTVTGVVEDERQRIVGEKASRTAYRILLPILGFTSLALFMAGGENEFYYIRALGIVLGYITCLGIMIHLLAYWYFNRQSGG